MVIKQHYNDIGKDIHNINANVNEKYYNQYDDFMDQIFVKKQIKDAYYKHYGPLQRRLSTKVPTLSRRNSASSII